MYAIITGGNSGLGLAIAKRLAETGYDLVLVARNGERLSAASADIVGAFPGRTVLTVPLDLSAPGAPGELFRITSEKGIHPDVLVNNAGMYIYGRTVDVDADRQKSLLGLNVMALTELCRLYGKDMASSADGSEKYILNIASYSVYMPIDGFALYAGSKAYVRTFSRCLAKELKGSGVKVTAVAPAGMDTGLMNLRPGVRRLARSAGFLASPDIIARISLRVMKTGCIHYWVPLWYNVLFIPFLWMFQPLFRRVL